MTLLELMVGLVVTGTVVALGHATFASISDHRARAAEATARVAEAAAVRRTIEEWLAGTRVLVEDLTPAFAVRRGREGEVPDDELRFFTEAETPLGPGAKVRLWIDRDPATPERGLVAEFTERDGARQARVEIAPGAAGLTLRFLSDEGGHPLWTDDWSRAAELPRAVEVRLLGGAGAALPALLDLPILVPLGGG
jgi:hypothetical protein